MVLSSEGRPWDYENETLWILCWNAQDNPSPAHFNTELMVVCN
jgi:hypothetical protein